MCVCVCVCVCVFVWVDGCLLRMCVGIDGWVNHPLSLTLSPEDDVLKELCVCGRVAEYECARCEGRGYCSEDCQEEDYKKHKKLCRKLKQQRKEDRRKQTTLMEPPVSKENMQCGVT